MEAKDRNMIWISDEVDFFTLIEKKLEEQGFQVLETMPPDKLSSDMMSSGRTRSKGTRLIFADRSHSRFLY